MKPIRKELLLVLRRWGLFSYTWFRSRELLLWKLWYKPALLSPQLQVTLLIFVDDVRQACDAAGEAHRCIHAVIICRESFAFLLKLWDFKLLAKWWTKALLLFICKLTLRGVRVKLIFLPSSSYYAIVFPVPTLWRILFTLNSSFYLISQRKQTIFFFQLIGSVKIVTDLMEFDHAVWHRRTFCFRLSTVHRLEVLLLMSGWFDRRQDVIDLCNCF